VKIFRYLDKAGSMGFGRFDEQGQMFLILKKENGDFEATDQRITPFRFLTPIDFRCIYGVGLNYKEHAKETGKEAPKYPMIFMKAPTSTQSAGDPVVIPRFLRSDKVDYEGELGVVIGKPCKNVKPEDALSYVLGYTCANDISARDWQKEKGGGTILQRKRI
jgi:2-keto-4-pentenoate hydratase/2-oxohepta-3-ene-1,7-dioic acid hydratase in catechol pathway